MKKILSTTIFLFFVVFSLYPQEAPKPILNNDDIDRFIKTYKPMVEELEELGHDLEMEEDEDDDGISDMSSYYAKMMEFSTAIRGQNEVMNILEKYGWNEDFMFKFSAIWMAYSYNKMEIEFAKMDAENQQYATQMMDMMKQQIAMIVHEDDIKLVKPRLEELDVALMDEE